MLPNMTQYGDDLVNYNGAEVFNKVDSAGNNIRTHIYKTISGIDLNYPTKFAECQICYDEGECSVIAEKTACAKCMKVILLAHNFDYVVKQMYIIINEGKRLVCKKNSIEEYYPNTINRATMRFARHFNRASCPTLPNTNCGLCGTLLNKNSIWCPKLVGVINDVVDNMIYKYWLLKEWTKIQDYDAIILIISAMF
jgi:hypothetical protein